jgi:glycosyltransferase involved in cell wall biosynthesis
MALTISVVIPAYKSAPWIEETIGSVVKQTYPLEDMELLVIDDASPDDTVRVARSVLDASPLKSKVIVREKNAGVTANRNAGWRQAAGDWIQFLDHDDVLMPHKLKLQAEYAARAAEDVGVVYSSWRSLELIDSSWQPTGPVKAPNVDEDTVSGLLKDEGFGYVGPTLIRKSALASVDGFEERPNLGEDSNLMLRLAMGGWKFRRAVSDEGHAFLYRQTPGSLWKSYAKNLVALWNLLLTFKMAEDFLRKQQPGQELPDEVRRALASQYGRRAPFFLGPEPEKFRTIQTWLAALGYPIPPNLRRSLQLACKVIGYRNTLRLRAHYQRVVEMTRG